VTQAPVTQAPIIAIVDDDASVRRALQRLVESAGYKVRAFASAREFLDWLPGEQAACLVLDVQMDGMSGFDLQSASESRGRPATCRSPSTPRPC